MSGGSFDYLYTQPAEELLNSTQTLTAMARQLEDIGASDVAMATEQIVAYVEHARRQIEARADLIRPVWKAVEWECSGDTSRENTEKVLAAYRNL